MSKKDFNHSYDVVEAAAVRFRKKILLDYPYLKDMDNDDLIKELLSLLNGSMEPFPKSGPAYTQTGGGLVVYPKGGFLTRVPCHTSRLMDNFFIAHDIGHLVMHVDRKELRKRTEPLRFPRFSSEKMAWQANRFGASLLMPKDEFLKVKEKYDGNMYKVSGYFCVSYSLVIERDEYLMEEC